MKYIKPIIRRMTKLETLGLMVMVQYPGLLDVDVELGEWQNWREITIPVQLKFNFQ